MSVGVYWSLRVLTGICRCLLESEGAYWCLVVLEGGYLCLWCLLVP